MKKERKKGEEMTQNTKKRKWKVEKKVKNKGGKVPYKGIKTEAR